MDPQLPAQLVQYLAPFLPYLLKGVKFAGQEAAKKLGEKAGELATGGNVSGSVIVTGDNNKVNKG